MIGLAARCEYSTPPWVGCDSVFGSGRPEGRLAMNWVLSHTEWIVFITVTVLLSLLMTVAIQGLDLRTVS